MKKLSIKLGENLYFNCFPSEQSIIHVSGFTAAYWTTDIGVIKETIIEIQSRIPGVEFSVVSHEPMTYEL